MLIPKPPTQVGGFFYPELVFQDLKIFRSQSGCPLQSFFWFSILLELTKKGFTLPSGLGLNALK
jgi:hypothetical protein